MSEQVSAYIQRCKSWCIKNILSNYFKAVNLYNNMYREYLSSQNVSFEKLKLLSEMLYDAKEEFHLVYKRLKDPKKNLFEDADKFTPNNAEMDFIHNVGLLFHKAMVARELKYMLDYYETDADEDYAELKRSLNDYMHRLRRIFDKGITLIEPFLRNFHDDVQVLAYFLEHNHNVESIIGEANAILFDKLDNHNAENSPYVMVAQYFIESGWLDRAKKVLYHALEKHPQDKKIREMLVHCG